MARVEGVFVPLKLIDDLRYAVELDGRREHEKLKVRRAEDLINWVNDHANHVV
jgi:hypothetical protein